MTILMQENFHYLERTALWERISNTEDVPLLLVTAPMGYGKSTLIREYLQKKEKQYFWIAIGQNPVQEEWLWNRIAQELSVVCEPLSLLMLQMGLPFGSDWEVSEANFMLLTRQMLSEHDFYLVIDDYQSCIGDKLNRFLTRLAYEDIDNTHTILISRNHIKMPIMEMQLKGYCTLISHADLIMSPAETAHLFAINGIALTQEQLKKIYEYTDGWIAAANLLWLDYQKKGWLQSSGSVNQLLKESVYAPLTNMEKKLLYPFSCFAELSIEELSCVTEMPVTVSHMDTLMEKTGLMHYNMQNHKYAIHTLLHTIVVEEGYGNRKEIYRRYAQRQKKLGNYISALENFEKSGDRTEIFQILDSEHRFEIIDLVPDFLLSFFRECKNSEEILQHPFAAFSYIYSMLISSNEAVLQEGIKFYTYIKNYYEAKENPTAEDKALLGELFIIDSLIVFNDLQAANKALEQAWLLREQKPSRIFSKKIYSYGVPNTLHMYHKEPGRLLETVESEIEYSIQYMRLMYNAESSLDKLIHAEYYLETGQVEQAFATVLDPLKKANFRQQTCIVISSFFVLLRCLIYQGHKNDFEEAMEKCSYFVHNKGQNITMLYEEYDLMSGYVYAILGQLDKIPLWLRKRQLENCNLIVRDSRNACMVYGIYLCRKKRWARLAANAEEMMLSFSGTRHVFSEIYANIFYAISLWYTDACEEAQKYYLTAYELAAPDRILMPFAELSEELLPLWQSVKENVNLSPELEALSHQWQNGVCAFKAEEHKEAIFTPREDELMTLLVQGYRNSEIGKRMNIAQVTVEKNLTNIYRKIGVSNRVGAIKWYNESYKAQ